MEENITQKAINFALQCNWKEAIKINLLILKNNNEDVGALNRLAHAYFETGKIPAAKKISLKVLRLDSNNTIAKNSLERYKQGKRKAQIPIDSNIDGSIFIEIPGKTKLTTLINLGSEKVCSYLNVGDEVFLNSHGHKMKIFTINKKYIGRLTDDLSARLKKMMREGYKYQILVKSAKKDCVKIFIKGDNISFPLESSESLDEFSS